MNDPYALISERNITLTDAIRKQVIGGEVAMWGEQVEIFLETPADVPLYIALTRRSTLRPLRAKYSPGLTPWLRGCGATHRARTTGSGQRGASCSRDGGSLTGVVSTRNQSDLSVCSAAAGNQPYVLKC